MIINTVHKLQKSKRSSFQFKSTEPHLLLPLSNKHNIRCQHLKISNSFPWAWEMACQKSILEKKALNCTLSDPSHGRERDSSPGWRMPLQRGIILSRVVPLCATAVIHGWARWGRWDRVRQMGIVTAGPSQKLGAQVVVVHPSRMVRHRGDWGQRCVVHRPKAAVLTLSRHGRTRQVA